MRRASTDTIALHGGPRPSVRAPRRRYDPNSNTMPPFWLASTQARQRCPRDRTHRARDRLPATTHTAFGHKPRDVQQPRGPPEADDRPLHKSPPSAEDYARRDPGTWSSAAPPPQARRYGESRSAWEARRPEPGAKPMLPCTSLISCKKTSSAFQASPSNYESMSA